MSTADELLNGLFDDIPEHDHKVVDSDTYFVIDPVTRQLDNSALLKNVIMQNDHNSEVFTFELPRYVEGHDMTLCNIVKVHFNNIESRGLEHPDVHDITDLHIDPDNPDSVICSWLITRDATRYPGNLTFLVQYLCTDNNGEIVYEWHTDFFSNVEIRATIDNGEAVVEEYSDILEQWRARLFGSKDSLVADIQAASNAQIDEIEAKGAATRATIPEDYTTTHEMADEALRRKADAIILSESGEHICLNDSSDCNLIGLNIYGKTTQYVTTGKNLFDITAALANQKVASNSATNYSAYGNGVHTTKDAYNNGRTFMYLDVPAGTYTASANIEATETWNFSVKVLDASIDLLSENHDATDKNASFTFTLDADSTVGFCFVPTMSVGIGVYATNIQLETGSEVTSWEPYSNGVASPSPEQTQELISVVNPTVYIHGKNLLDGIFDDGIYEGTSLNPDSDGVYKSLKVFLTPGSYTISFSTPASIVRFGIDRGDTISTTTNITSFTFPMIDAGTVWITFRDATSSSTVWDSSNIVQIVKSVDAGNFEEYASTQTLALVLTRTLYGVPVSQNGNYTDSNGQQWICDEIDYERGKYIQRIGKTDFTGVSWTKTGNGKYFASEHRGIYDNSYGVLCTHITGGTQSDGGKNNVIFINSNNDIRLNTVIGIEDDEDITAMMSGAILIGVLITPIETDLTEVELEAFRALHTNATDTTIFNDQNAKMAVKYVADLERYIYKNVSNKKRKFNITFVESNWVLSSDGRYYTQVLDITARPTAEITLQPTASQQVSLILDGIAIFIVNDNGVLTAYSINGTPGKDITVPATETVVVYE